MLKTGGFERENYGKKACFEHVLYEWNTAETYIYIVKMFSIQHVLKRKCFVKRHVLSMF